MDSVLKAQLEGEHEAGFHWALSCTGGDRIEAEEVLQSVYLEILEGKARFDGNSSLRTWLFAVIRNTARNRQRRRKYRQLLLLKWEDPRPSPSRADEDLHRSEEKAKLREALEILSTRQREVLDLVFYHDLTIEEAARVLGVSVGSARTHYHRGKTRLSQELMMKEEPWAPKMTNG